MMGDREKCIQAQMDEYLSKPLQPNHLIQTIFKCATLGCELLEKNRERELARQGEAAENKKERVRAQEGASKKPPAKPSKHSYQEADDALTRVCSLPRPPFFFGCESPRLLTRISSALHAVP